MAKVHTFFKYKFRYTVCVKKKLWLKKQSTDLTSFAHIKVKRHKY